jgi:uncharacterized protein DUF4054
VGIAWEDVIAIASELADLNEDAQDMILAYVNDWVQPIPFGGEASSKLRLARAYLAAHYGSLTSQGGSTSAGPVISETVGDISRTYASGVSTALSSGDALLDSTVYGKNYRALLRGSLARLPFVT